MRLPAVAGQFYPGNPSSLAKEVDSLLAAADAREKNVVSLVAPHAGYSYSGKAAAFSFKALKASHPQPPSLVLIGPNHTGFGSPVSLSLEDWQTPLGLVKNDQELGRQIAKSARLIDLDEAAHRLEHSLEVQLPFLQRIYKDFSFVPICMGVQDEESASDAALAISKAADSLKRKVVVVASSDFTHYEPAELAKKKDEAALKEILALKTGPFVRLVREKNLSICGFGPIACAMEYARLRGVKSGRLLKYASSGEASGDFSSVVAYASIIFSEE